MADAVNNSTTSPSSSSSSISSPRRDTILSADDVLPLTVYLIIHSQLTPINANLQYMLHFTPDKNDINIDHLSVHVTMMQAAVQVCQRCGWRCGCRRGCGCRYRCGCGCGGKC